MFLWTMADRGRGSAIHRAEIEIPVEVYAMSEIERAHDEMEQDRVTAKQVVLTRGEP